MAVTAQAYNGRALNTVEMGIKVSQEVLPKIFTKIAYQKGFMVNDRYSADAENSLDILIPKFNRPTGAFESIAAGSSYNPFSTTAEEATLTYSHLTVDLEYRKPIQIAEAQILQNVIGDKVIGTMTEYVSKSVAEQINLLTAQAMFSAAIDYDQVATKVNKLERVDLTDSTDSIPDAMARLIADIGNADPTEGDTSFNDYPLSQVISNTTYARLMSTKNQFLLESSYGQELLIAGTLGEIKLSDVSSYKGRILGVSTFVLPDAFFPALNNAKFTENPTAGKVLGIMAVAEATERVFVDRGIKVTDAVNFRGWVLQPLYRLGVATLKPWGVGLLVTEDFAYAA